MTACPLVNVASVPQRSPFRYPGGKTWLVPRIRQWLSGKRVAELIEPFAGGAIVGLTAAFERLADRVTLVELDDDIASVWETILGPDCDWLIDRIRAFEPTPQTVLEAVATGGRSSRDRAFATVVRNRVSRGGILAPGAGIVKSGENGRGLLSRWYPQTLCRRIAEIAAVRSRLRFVHGDGIAVLDEYSARSDTAFFIDPPYTVAGRRLYLHSDLDHDDLLCRASRVAGDLLITYDETDEVRRLALAHRLQTRRVPMKTTHHLHKWELLIGHEFGWFTG